MRDLLGATWSVRKVAAAASGEDGATEHGASLRPVQRTTSQGIASIAFIPARDWLLSAPRSATNAIRRAYGARSWGSRAPGYDKKRKFVDEGVTLRKKYHLDDADEAGSSVFQNVSDSVFIAQADSNQEQQTTQSFNGTASTPNFNSVRSPGSVLGSIQNVGPQHAASPAFSVSALAGTDGMAFNGHRVAGMNIANLLSAPISTTDDLVNPLLLPTSSYAIPTVEADDLIDNLWAEPVIDPDWFNIEPDEFYSNGNNSCGFIPNLPSIVDEVDKKDLNSRIDTTATPMSGFSSLPEQ